MAFLQFIILTTMVCFGFEERSVSLRLLSDGSLKDPTRSPKCSQGFKIDLISYSYCWFKCPLTEYCKKECDKPLTPAAEFALHKTCSWQEKCDNLVFPPLLNNQNKTIDSVKIKFKCSDMNETTVNMCRNQTILFSQRLYITADDTVTMFESCECFLKNGKFSVSINDVRLSSKTGNSCSSVKLLINSNIYQCSSLLDGYGSVFNKWINDSTKSMFVAIKPNQSNMVPAMIMLAIYSKETAKITCEGISLDLTTRPNGTRSISRDAKMNGVSQLKTSLAQDPEHEISNSTASRNVKYLNNLYVNESTYPSPEASDKNQMDGLMGVLSIVIPLVLLLICVVFGTFCYRIYFRTRHTTRKQTEEEIGFLTVQTHNQEESRENIGQNARVLVVGVQPGPSGTWEETRPVQDLPTLSVLNQTSQSQTHGNEMRTSFPRLDNAQAQAVQQDMLNCSEQERKIPEFPSQNKRRLIKTLMSSPSIRLSTSLPSVCHTNLSYSPERHRCKSSSVMDKLYKYGKLKFSAALALQKSEIQHKPVMTVNTPSTSMVALYDVNKEEDTWISLNFNKSCR